MTNVVSSDSHQPVEPVPTSAIPADSTPVVDALTGQTTPPHRPADDTEQIYFEGSPQARTLPGYAGLWGLVGVFLLAIPVAFFFYRGRHQIIQPWWIDAILIAAAIGFLLAPYLKSRSVRYRISNYRIDFEHGWFSRDINTIELWHVEDLRFHQSFADRILGVGTITVLSHDELLPKLILFGLPNPRSLFDTLKQRVIAVKRQSGVIKVDNG